MGFGVKAAVTLPKKKVALRAHLEHAFLDQQTRVGCGCVLGPATLVNAACSRHANCKLDKNYSVVPWRRAIKPGETLWACYAGGSKPFTCPVVVGGEVCGRRINGHK